MIELNESEVRRIRVSIVECVGDICAQRGLDVLPAFSTLLGAVRHEDFVPWLVSAEICLPRPHYDELLTCFDEEARVRGLNYRVIRPFTQDYPSHSAYIEDADTAIAERGENPRGVGVSVFPIDGLGEDLDRARFRAREIKLLCLAYKVKTVDKSFALREKSALTRLIIRLYAEFVPSEYISAKVESLCRKTPYGDSKYVGIPASLHGEKTVFERPSYEKGEVKNFSTAKVVLPAAYDEILTALYGEYMLFPPLAERTGREFKAYKKEPKE